MAFIKVHKFGGLSFGRGTGKPGAEETLPQSSGMSLRFSRAVKGNLPQMYCRGHAVCERRPSSMTPNQFLKEPVRVSEAPNGHKFCLEDR